VTIETILRAVLREELQTMLKPQQAAPPSPAPLSIEENLALTVQECSSFQRGRHSSTD
jgi:hypothetical protein